ncbi:hypothetical protein CEXT_465391 [Caerostris extrusa]|uniref:Uncharacterized protein n=1 Tax=Caerostris extrusa TaxID=172846 RepID=A0AAV4TU64_CAEEX|nr:hypothetical protein CEXT_465391 [Caerostris extrusa]
MDLKKFLRSYFNIKSVVDKIDEEVGFLLFITPLQFRLYVLFVLCYALGSIQPRLNQKKFQFMATFTSFILFIAMATSASSLAEESKSSVLQCLKPVEI